MKPLKKQPKNFRELDTSIVAACNDVDLEIIVDFIVNQKWLLIF